MVKENLLHKTNECRESLAMLLINNTMFVAAAATYISVFFTLYNARYSMQCSLTPQIGPCWPKLEVNIKMPVVNVSTRITIHEVRRAALLSALVMCC